MTNPVATIVSCHTDAGNITRDNTCILISSCRPCMSCFFKAPILLSWPVNCHEMPIWINVTVVECWQKTIYFLGSPAFQQTPLEGIVICHPPSWSSRVAAHDNWEIHWLIAHTLLFIVSTSREKVYWHLSTAKIAIRKVFPLSWSPDLRWNTADTAKIQLKYS